ncbi:hypothetical protein RN001_005930 [Aquatica leii]|uniref:MADF domain-containing protein n=1 Tax=Aquatica leii TaxID=1421715 RepID=A0AAN7PHQ9_9COLE|nr:hypothetical protein RN001_005930 [Aquatica leii]
MDKSWKRAAVTTLIYLYKEKTCLWQVSCPQYTNKVLRTEAWNSITAALNAKWSLHFTIKDVSAKVASLRTNLSKELKLIKASKPTGTGDEAGLEIFDPTWWAFHLLLFLQEHITPATKSASNLNINNTSSTICAGEYELQTNGFGKKRKFQNVAQEEAYQMIEKATHHIEKLSQSKDDVETFATTVEADMRQIRNKTLIRRAKRRILEILQELQEEDETIS